jgi:hypothetical protein
VIDFSLIIVAGLVVDLWIVYFVAVLEGLAGFTLGWLLFYLFVAVPTTIGVALA